jgi:hypothetical protein
VTTPHTQPRILPFPGYPKWGLFFCTHWLAAMEDGIPRLPAHVEAAITIEKPRGGHVVTCTVPSCAKTWFFRANTHDWLSLPTGEAVPMPAPERRRLYNEGLEIERDAKIEMASEERFERIANAVFDLADPPRATEFNPPPIERKYHGKPE